MKDKIMELQEHMIVPKHRTSKGSVLLGLLLIAGGYWTTNQALNLWHKAVIYATDYSIQKDLAGVKIQFPEGYEKTPFGKAAYSTSLKLDRCMDSLAQVQEAIKPLPLGGPEALQNSH